MRCIKPIVFAFLFFLTILPHCASAASEIRPTLARHILQWVGENARQNYEKHLTAMKQHSEPLASLRKELAATTWNEQSAKHVEGLKEEIGKHIQKFNQHSTAAGHEFRTNRLLYQTIRKIRPAEETEAHKALRLVGGNAAQQPDRHNKLIEEHYREAMRLSQVCKSKYPTSSPTRPGGLTRDDLEAFGDIVEQQVVQLESCQRAHQALKLATATKQSLFKTIKGIRPGKNL